MLPHEWVAAIPRRTRENRGKRKQAKRELQQYMDMRGWSLEDLGLVLVYKGYARFRNGRRLTQSELEWARGECDPELNEYLKGGN